MMDEDGTLGIAFAGLSSVLKVQLVESRISFSLRLATSLSGTYSSGSDEIAYIINRAEMSFLV